MSRVRRVIRKTKWVRRKKHDHVETLRPFQPAIQINSVNQQPFQINAVNQPPFQTNTVNQPPIKVEQAHREPVIDYVSLATKAAKALNQKTSLDHIDKVAADLFKFDADPQLHITMPDIEAQEIFDWIITLSEQPIHKKEKLRLARQFIDSLAPVSSPVEKPEAL